MFSNSFTKSGKVLERYHMYWNVFTLDEDQNNFFVTGWGSATKSTTAAEA